ncbi:epoxyqueuosine reductase QueH [Ruminococcaceae bacterium OttesenSCG-928-D13]|nr:epoxyqueuosine reductase QueH [Ruminococcaceae bacterium OttesenSCG-928-D13]
MPNYDSDMRLMMERLPGGTPLLLHACCGPCAATALDRLAGHFAVTLYYYNPNTMPQAEYQKRLEGLQTLVARFPAAYPVRLIEGPWDNERFLERARGMEALPEGGARCEACFALRLEQTARAARENGFEWFGTTLTTGPRKNAALVNQSGEAAGEAHGVGFLPADFKKQGGVLRSRALCEEYGIYRQHYCGCAFSLPQGLGAQFLSPPGD